MEKPKSYTKFEVELPEGAEPTEWVQLNFAQTSKLRWLYCSNYSKCLSYAAGQSWLSFVCVFCPVWAKRKEKSE